MFTPHPAGDINNHTDFYASQGKSPHGTRSGRRAALKGHHMSHVQWQTVCESLWRENDSVQVEPKRCAELISPIPRVNKGRDVINTDKLRDKHCEACSVFRGRT